MIKRITVGVLSTNCYIIYDEITKDAMVVDPGYEDDEIYSILLKAADVKRKPRRKS